MKDRHSPDPEELLARARKPAETAMRLHPFYRGKIQMLPKCPVSALEDFAIWYTPGVAEPCRAIAAEPERVFELTNRGNSVAVLSNGTRVLGLGDIGPAAGLPVMEGKALLFKVLGGIDAVPLCIDARDPEHVVSVARAIAPTFGGINLEDIRHPDCFQILAALREDLGIPVWHDDQQGTATVTLAGLRNALDLVGLKISDARIALVGVGAANVANLRLLVAAGADPAAVVACDRGGILHPDRDDLEQVREQFPDKWQIANTTNGERRTGGIAEALVGAHVCLAFSAPVPGTISPEWISSMAPDPIVFACANPAPEIWPWEAEAAGARIVATGRGDFPNQVNNSLGFPGIFRGALDVRARSISDGMALAASDALAHFARERLDLSEEAILPTMSDWEVFVEEAVATALAAQREGLTSDTRSPDTLRDLATRSIQNARDSTRALMESGLIAPRPDR